jgi:hypothetical protein
MSNTSERLRLKSSHPVSKKLDKLAACADELGIRISFCLGPAMVSLEVHGDDTEYLIEDLEGMSGEYNASIDSFPPIFEHKITMENPKWTEETRKEQEAVLKRIEEKEKARKKAEIKAQKKAKKQEAERIEKAELAELKRLECKYRGK